MSWDFTTDLRSPALAVAVQRTADGGAVLAARSRKPPAIVLGADRLDRRSHRLPETDRV